MFWGLGFRWVGGAIMAGAVVGVVACGGGGEKVSGVEVRLSEWEIGVSGAPVAGEVRFEVGNEGSLAHNLVVVKSDLPAGELPVVDGRVEVSRLNVVGGAGPVAPGTSLEGDSAYEVGLTAGKYVLFCDVVSGGESHYMNGMYALVLVEP